jgi:hypothetical protein
MASERADKGIVVTSNWRLNCHDSPTWSFGRISVCRKLLWFPFLRSQCLCYYWHTIQALTLAGLYTA